MNIFCNTSKPTNRLEKGKSLLATPTDYTIIDIETTGLDTNYDEIIELSAIRVRNNGKKEIFQSLVKPHQEISGFISSLTGITNDMLQSAPSLDSTLPAFLSFINNDIVIGHNVNFDVNFIYDFSQSILDKPFSNNFVDTMRLSRKLFKDSPNHKLLTLAKHLNLSSMPTHRSLSDCETTLELYQFIYKCLDSNGIELKNLFQQKNVESFFPEAKNSNKVFCEDKPLFNQTCVFTGSLEKMLRKDAMRLVVNSGGFCSNTVNKNTNFLILGNLDYCSNLKDNESSKLKKAKELILAGNDLQIISENVFYSILDIT